MLLCIRTCFRSMRAFVETHTHEEKHKIQTRFRQHITRHSSNHVSSLRSHLWRCTRRERSTKYRLDSGSMSHDTLLITPLWDTSKFSGLRDALGVELPFVVSRQPIWRERLVYLGCERSGQSGTRLMSTFALHLCIEFKCTSKYFRMSVSPARLPAGPLSWKNRLVWPARGDWFPALWMMFFDSRPYSE
jgi:hypothetical protein